MDKKKEVLTDCVLVEFEAFDKDAFTRVDLC